MTGTFSHSFDKFFAQYPALSECQDIAVAVSGGPDSMALAHMLIVWAEETGKVLHGLTVDHGLRAEAKNEAEDVAEWMHGLKAQHKILTWEGNKPDTAIMEAARAARYQLMATYCREHKINTLFIAHHQEDQAETFLIRLSKGSGLDGLAAMGCLRNYDDNLILARPLLDVPKEYLIRYCEDNKIPYITDPSNENENYMRPRLRKSMNVLEGEGLSAKRLATTAKRLARARQALESISAQAYEEAVKEQTPQHIVFDFVQLQKHPVEIGLRVLQSAIEKMRPEANYNVRMEKLEELFESLWTYPEAFKPRTLGGCIFSLKNDKQDTNKQDINKALWIEKEHS